MINVVARHNAGLDIPVSPPTCRSCTDPNVLKCLTCTVLLIEWLMIILYRRLSRWSYIICSASAAGSSHVQCSFEMHCSGDIGTLVLSVICHRAPSPIERLANG